eukprot:403345883
MKAMGMLVTAYKNPHSSETTIVTEFVNNWNQLYFSTFSSYTVKLDQSQDLNVMLPLSDFNDMPLIFRDEVPQYQPGYFINTDIKIFLKGLQGLKKIPNNDTSFMNDGITPKLNSEYNLTADFNLVVLDSLGATVANIVVQDLVIMKKIRTNRMLKDCNMNHQGQWNSTEQKCYAFSQLNSICYILDETKQYIQPIQDYQLFKCDGKEPDYLKYSALNWGDASIDPSIKDFRQKVQFLVKSSQDPVTQIFLSPEIKHEAKSSAMVSGGIFMLVFGVLIEAIPICAYLNAQKPNNYISSDRKKFYRV